MTNCHSVFLRNKVKQWVSFSIEIFLYKKNTSKLYRLTICQTIFFNYNQTKTMKKNKANYKNKKNSPYISLTLTYKVKTLNERSEKLN